MSRAASILAAMLLAVATSAHGQDAESESPREFPTPPYLPRAAFIGLFLKTTVTAELRFQWEFTLMQRRVHALVLILEGGGGYGIAFPQNVEPTGTVSMTRFRQLTTLLGIGVRADEPGSWHWGGQIATGPLFYSARYSDATSENAVWPMVEARAQVGVRFGSTVYGLFFGYALPYPGQTQTRTTPFIGGWMLGLFADRR